MGRRPQQTTSGLSNHQLLVCRDDPDGGGRIIRRDDLLVAAIAVRIKMNAQKIQPLANAFADWGRTLANARGKDQQIQPTKRGGKTA
jgi:hypothetical protein